MEGLNITGKVNKILLKNKIVLTMVDRLSLYKNMAHEGVIDSIRSALSTETRQGRPR